MTKHRRAGAAAAILGAPLAGVAALAACVGATLPTQLYTLDAAAPVQPSTTRAGARAGAAAAAPAVGLGPVALPAYLDRPEIVTREGLHQLRVGEFDRWAEPLQPVFARLLADRLRAAAGGREVVLVPGARGVPDPRVAVGADVDRFDADEEGRVTLDARWRVYDAADGVVLASGREVVVEQGAPAPDYPAIVAAMARAVDGLARRIAPAVARAAATAGPGARPARGT